MPNPMYRLWDASARKDGAGLTHDEAYSRFHSSSTAAEIFFPRADLMIAVPLGLCQTRIFERNLFPVSQ
ncbi:hypothetical protein [Microseira wollei]|nr:hypothetical protein [Microseira wollei]